MFFKRNIKDISVEKTPHGSGSRRVLVAKKESGSTYFEAFTHGYLPAGEKWEMHQHDDIIEICLVIKGTGVIRDEHEREESFVLGDRFIFPPNTKHQIMNTSQTEDEFYFIRARSS